MVIKMAWFETLDKKITDYLPDLEYVKDEPMTKHISFRVGGPAKRMAFPKNAEQVVLLMSFAEECGARPLVIGNGTNLLAPDEGLDRLVINMAGEFASVGLTGECELTATAGISLARLALFACEQSLTGLEFAHGIPGTLGGAVVMNAGAYGGEMKDVITSVTMLDSARGIVTLSAEEMQFSYRRSILNDHPEYVVLSATFRLQKGDADAIGAKMRELMEKRKASQPLEYPSAGSTFKRPTGYYAGPLIEGCGLKGCRVGGAEVSRKHAGFVINVGGATCADVLALIEEVQKTVYDVHGVMLEPEVKIVR